MVGTGVGVLVVLIVFLWWLGVLVVAVVSCFRPRWGRFLPLLALVGAPGITGALGDVGLALYPVALALALFYAARVRPWLAAVLVTVPMVLWGYSDILSAPTEWDAEGRPTLLLGSARFTNLLWLAFALAAAYSGLFVQRLLARRWNRSANFPGHQGG